MLSKIKTRFYVGNNHITRINVRRAGAQAKSGGHKKLSFLTLLDSSQNSRRLHIRVTGQISTVLYTTSYKLIYIYINYLILFIASTMSLFMLIVGGWFGG
jgi:hypothetical protein